MKDYDLATRRKIEIALLVKGQESRRYKLGETWELNYDEIKEALDELTPSYTKNPMPSAQPERSKGYMKIKVISAVDGEGLFCENCDTYCLSPLYNFCPKCGVEFIGVRGEQDEID